MAANGHLTGHPVRAWGGAIVGIGAALGIGWSVLQQLERYDLALSDLADRITQLQTISVEADARKTQRDNDWLAADNSQHERQSILIGQVLDTQKGILSSLARIEATVAAADRDISTLTLEVRGVHDSALRVGADIQFALGEHIGRHHRSKEE